MCNIYKFVRGCGYYKVCLKQLEVTVCVFDLSAAKNKTGDKNPNKELIKIKWSVKGMKLLTYGRAGGKSKFAREIYAFSTRN